MTQLTIGQSFAGYIVERVLGEGGMGVVYLARHPRLPRYVALKLLTREVSGDPELRRRFERESDIAARLEHPGIVDVLDRGSHDGQLWIAMQYISGGDITRFPSGQGDIARALRIVSDVANALDHAHRRGILHRDIKPANIMLSTPEDGRPERAVLTDFGIARLLDNGTTLTATGTLTATIAYASPEQLSGAELDHRTDQYSLACTLFTLLTGAPPYPEANPGQVVTGHLHKPVPRLSWMRPDIPAAMDDVVARALAKDRADRFDSCGAFAAAASHALRQSMSIGSPTPDIVPTTWQRNRTPLLAALVILVVVATAASVVLWRKDSGSDTAGSTTLPPVPGPKLQWSMPIEAGSRGLTAYAGTVYVTTPTGSVTVIDAATKSVKDVIPIGPSCTEVAFDVGTGNLYVSTSDGRGTDWVSVVDPIAKSVIATIPTGHNGQHLALDASGRTAYVTADGAIAGTTVLKIIDMNSKSVKAELTLEGTATSVAIDAWASAAFVGTRTATPTGHYETTLHRIDFRSNTEIATIPLGIDSASLSQGMDTGILAIGVESDTPTGLPVLKLVKGTGIVKTVVLRDISPAPAIDRGWGRAYFLTNVRVVQGDSIAEEQVQVMNIDNFGFTHTVPIRSTGGFTPTTAIATDPTTRMIFALDLSTLSALSDK